jgi:class 3 adenylate cyclase
VLIDGRVQAAVEAWARATSVGEVTLKGIRRPVAAFVLGEPG